AGGRVCPPAGLSATIWSVPGPKLETSASFATPEKSVAPRISPRGKDLRVHESHCRHGPDRGLWQSHRPFSFLGGGNRQEHYRTTAHLRSGLGGGSLPSSLGNVRSVPGRGRNVAGVVRDTQASKAPGRIGGTVPRPPPRLGRSVPHPHERVVSPAHRDYRGRGRFPHLSPEQP